MYSELVTVFADLEVFQQKAQNFHWNVTGPDFYQTHLLFDRVYNTVNEYIDRLAEHIRGYGRAPGLHSAFLELSSIKETLNLPDRQTMIRILYDDAQVVYRDISIAAKMAAADYRQGTANLLGELAETFDSILFLLGANQPGYNV